MPRRSAGSGEVLFPKTGSAGTLADYLQSRMANVAKRVFSWANAYLYRNITRHLHKGQGEPHLYVNDDLSPAEFLAAIEKPSRESSLNGHDFSRAAKGQ